VGGGGGGGWGGGVGRGCGPRGGVNNILLIGKIEKKKVRGKSDKSPLKEERNIAPVFKGNAQYQVPDRSTTENQRTTAKTE